MTKAGFFEAGRRITTLVFLMAGLIALCHAYSGIGIASLIVALLAYLFVPRVPAPEGALVYERGSAVIGPDIVGFMLTAPLLAAPFCVGVLATMLLFWPVGLIAAVILAYATWYASCWVLIQPDHFVIATARRELTIPYDQVKYLGTYRRGLPKWLKKFVPFLIMSGKFSAAGALLTARDETGMELKFADGSSQRIPASAFAGSFDLLLNAFAEHHVEMAPSFEKRR